MTSALALWAAGGYFLMTVFALHKLNHGYGSDKPYIWPWSPMGQVGFVGTVVSVIVAVWLQ